MYGKVLRMLKIILLSVVIFVAVHAPCRATKDEEALPETAALFASPVDMSDEALGAFVMLEKCLKQKGPGCISVEDALNAVAFPKEPRYDSLRLSATTEEVEAMRVRFQRGSSPKTDAERRVVHAMDRAASSLDDPHFARAILCFFFL